MQFSPKSRKTNIVVQEFESDYMIYDLHINKAFCLNETMAAVYKQCDGTKTVAEITDLLSTNLQISVSEDLVFLALKELEREKLLENEEQFRDKFAGMSRREIVKRVGLSSLIAFPIIISVVAPPAVAAQSGPICPMTGECFVANSPICGGDNCAGDYPVTLFAANSNCGGAPTGIATLMCTPAVGMFAIDVRIN